MEEMHALVRRAKGVFKAQNKIIRAVSTQLEKCRLKTRAFSWMHLYATLRSKARSRMAVERAKHGPATAIVAQQASTHIADAPATGPDETAAHETAQAENGRLRTELTTLQRQLEASRAETDRLRKEAKVAKTTATTQRRFALRQLARIICVKAIAFSGMKQAVAQTRLDEATKTVAELRDTVTTTQTQLDEATTTVTQLNHVVASQITLIAKTRAEADEASHANKKSDKLVSQIGRIKGRRTALAAELTSLKDQHVALQAEKDSLEERHVALQAETDRIKAERDSTQAETINDLQTRLNAAALEITQLCGQGALWIQQRDKAQAEVQELVGERAETEHAADNAKRETETLVTVLETRIAERGRRVAELEAYTAKVNDENGRVWQVISELRGKFMCCIAQDNDMQQPVVASDGHSYELNAIQGMFRYARGRTVMSPATREPITNVFHPNCALKGIMNIVKPALQRYLEQHGRELPATGNPRDS